MSETYEFTRTGVCPSDLTHDINEDNRITVNCLAVTVNDIDNVAVIMASPLNESQQTILESIVIAHVCEGEPPGEPGDVDPITGVNVSFAEMTLLFSESQLTDHDWVQIGQANDSDSGYVMPANGVITRVTGQVEKIEKGDVPKSISLFIDNVEHPNLLQFGPNSTRTNDLDTFHNFNGDDDVYNQRRIKNDLNIQFNAGQKLRLRANTENGSKLNDTVLTVWFKWRN
jgi:hypothetical protein